MLDPAGHRGVLGLGGLDGQPRDARLRELLQQVPDRLRLARAGRAGDERVPVQRRQRHPERADRAVLAVEDRARAISLARRAASASLVTSKNPASSTRTPGTSRRGSPASAASAPAVAANGAAAPSAGSCRVDGQRLGEAVTDRGPDALRSR